MAADPPVAPRSAGYYRAMADLPISRIARSGQLGRFAARQAVRNARLRFDRFANPSDADEQATARAFLAAADELVGVLGTMKGAAMKIGQMLSIIDVGMVPEESREHFRRKLAVLCDQAPPVSFPRMQQVLEEDLGRPLDTVFAEFERQPIAAASIGQVYRARLLDGRLVAVKVQYAGIAAAVRADLKNLALLLKISKPLLPTFSSRSFVEEIRSHIEAELDYECEALTQHELAQFYAEHPLITVPDTVSELCTRRVLVMEFVEGKQFNEICTLPADVRDRVGELIYRFYLGSVFHHYQFNGDPHPGNVMLADDGRVAFLDFGLFKRMQPDRVELERSGLRAAMVGDADEFRAVLGRSGVLSTDAQITAAEALQYAYDGSPWTFDDELLEVTPELAGGAFMLIADPRSADFERMRKETLPAEHFFLRRADFYTFGMLGQLHATANWCRIAREWLFDDPPLTEIGRIDADWRTSKLGPPAGTGQDSFSSSAP